jgi:hypothetical protein
MVRQSMSHEQGWGMGAKSGLFSENFSDFGIDTFAATPTAGGLWGNELGTPTRINLRQSDTSCGYTF